MKIRFLIVVCFLLGIFTSLVSPISQAPVTEVPSVQPPRWETLERVHSPDFSLLPSDWALVPSSDEDSNASAEINVASIGGVPLVDDSEILGPHVTLNGTWEPLDIPGFPTLKIRQTCLEFFEVVEQEHYGTIYPPVQSGWSPDVNPREDYDYVYLKEGSNVYIEMEYGHWTAGEGSVLWHAGSDHLDFFVWPPGVEHFYNNSLLGYTWGNPSVGIFTAPVTGNYTIGIDYYSGEVPMGWRVYVKSRSYVQGTTMDGRSVEYDTAEIGYNDVFDVQLRMVTGTSLDYDDSFTCHHVSNVTITNFFPPNVTVLYPGATPGNIEGPGLVIINWTGSDPNYDEVLQYSVEVSNDLGKTWKIITYTLRTQIIWDPTSAFYGLPPTPYEADGTRIPNFLVRVNVTDGRFSASDVSDYAWIISEPIILVDHFELIIFVFIGVVVTILIIIDVAVFLYRRNRPRKKLATEKT